MLNARVLAGSLVLCFAAAGCGSRQVDTSIPVNDARNLNSDLSAAYVRTTDLLEGCAESAAQVGRLPSGVDGNDFDVAMVREVLLSCFTEPTSIAIGADMEELPRRAEALVGEGYTPLTERGAVGRIDPCAPARMIALEAYLDVVSPDLRAFLTDRTLAVDALRVNLKDVAIAQLDDLERFSNDAASELVRLRTLTEERRALAQGSELDEEAQRQSDRDYDAMIAELDQIGAILETLQGEITNMRSLRRTLVEDVERDLAVMGTAP